MTTEQVLLPSLQLGPLRVTLVPAVIRDLSYFQDSLSAHVDVIVGIDVLSRTSFTVDYEARKLILGPAELLSNSVPCDPRSPYPTVALRLGNRVVRVLVDRGAGTRPVREAARGPLAGWSGCQRGNSNEHGRTGRYQKGRVPRIGFGRSPLGAA